MPPRPLSPRRSLLACALALSAAGIFASVPLAHAETLGPNLIQNPSFESGSSGAPTAWKQGGYGDNARTFTYPASPAHTGARAAKVAITRYGSGDAKWYFPAVPIEGGASYRFSDWFTATVPSEVDVQVTHANGSTSYIVLAHPAAASAYAAVSIAFTVPSDATAVTIFHVINSVG